MTKSACTSNPCVNGGTCVDATNNDGSLLEGVIFTNHSQYKCVCPTGYAGVNCQSKFIGEMKQMKRNNGIRMMTIRLNQSSIFPWNNFIFS